MIVHLFLLLMQLKFGILLVKKGIELSQVLIIG